MKRKYTTALLAIGCIAWLGLTGCEQARTRHLHDQIVTDKDGREWLLEHHIGDTYVLKPLPERRK